MKLPLLFGTKLILCRWEVNRPGYCLLLKLVFVYVEQPSKGKNVGVENKELVI